MTAEGLRVGMCPLWKEAAVGIWVGIDIGKEVHYALALDDAGHEVLAREIANTEAAIERLRQDCAKLGSPVFALDMTEGPAALTLATLASRGEDVRYVAGLAVNRSRAMFAGESKTDRRDALTIAENLRLRAPSLPRFSAADETLETLRLLMRRRSDILADRTRTVNRLRDTLLSYFPGLERAFPNLSGTGPLLLLARYNRPSQIRRAGVSRIEKRLKAAGAVKAGGLAVKAITAAKEQTVRVPGEDTASAIVAELASEALSLGGRLKQVDSQVSEAFFSLPQAEIIVSMPGFGPRLGAEFVVETGDIARFPSSGHLAAYAGLAPVSRDSGKISGNRMRAWGGSKRLKNVLFQAAFIASVHDEKARAYYTRKRAEGKLHNQAVIALARRRTDVRYAMLVHRALYVSEPVAA